MFELFKTNNLKGLVKKKPFFDEIGKLSAVFEVEYRADGLSTRTFPNAV